jgi:hypothetical protein
VLPASAFALPDWTAGLEDDGEAADEAELGPAGLDGLTTVAVMVLETFAVEVTLPYEGGIPPPDGLTTGGAGAAEDTLGG